MHGKFETTSYRELALVFLLPDKNMHLSYMYDDALSIHDTSHKKTSIYWFIDSVTAYDHNRKEARGSN